MLRFSSLLFAVFGLAAIAASAIDTNQHVILVTIDGGAAFYFDDPKAPLTNVRKLAAEGVVAKGIRVSNPSVTWPNHTTLVTGVKPAKHSVLYNGVMLPNKEGGLTREPEKMQADLVVVPTVFDFLHEKGFRTAAINWPCTAGSTSLDDNFPDVPNAIRYTTPKLAKELAAAGILEDATDKNFSNKSGAKRDTIWGDAACYVLRTRRPNLLLLHFLQADAAQHQVGPQHPEAYAALDAIDQHIGKLLETLDQTGLRKNTSIIITADHGFGHVSKHILGATVLHKAGLLETDDGKTRVQFISEGGTAMVYLQAEKTKQADRQKVIKLFKGLEGIEQIVEPKNFAQYGYPAPEKNIGMADLVLAAKDGYNFSSGEGGGEVIMPAGERMHGSHGYLASNPNMNGLFIAAGRGIAKGKIIDLVENIAVAPTVSYLLGQIFPTADGKVLTKILRDP